MRSVAYSVCSVDPGTTLFVQATCLNKSSQPTPSSPSPSAVVVLVFWRFPRFPRVIGCVLRGNLINCLATSTLLLFWHKIPFYFYLPWPIFGGATSFFDSSISSRFSSFSSPRIVSIFYLLLCVYYLTLAVVLGQAQNCDISWCSMGQNWQERRRGKAAEARGSRI